MTQFNNVYNLLEIFDYTKSEIEYGLCKALQNHQECKFDHTMIMNYAIKYIERDIKRNPKYL